MLRYPSSLPDNDPSIPWYSSLVPWRWFPSSSASNRYRASVLSRTTLLTPPPVVSSSLRESVFPPSASSSSSSSVRWCVSLLVTMILTYQFTITFHTLGSTRTHSLASSSSSSSSSTSPLTLSHLRDKLWSTLTTASTPPPCRITKCKACPIHPSPSSLPRTSSCNQTHPPLPPSSLPLPSVLPPTPPFPSILDPSLTKQQCYQLEDESELCIYDGPVCYDGEHLIVIVADGTTGLPPSMAAVSEAWKTRYAKLTGRYPTRMNDHDLDIRYFDHGLGPRKEGGITPSYRHSFYENGPCMDWRTMESSRACLYHNRPYRDPPAVANECTVYNSTYTANGMGSLLYAQTCSSAIISTGVRGRAWGPDGKTLQIHEMTRTDFINFQHAAERLRVWDGTMIEFGEVVERVEENFTRSDQDDEDEDGGPHSTDAKDKGDADGLIDETRTRKYRRVTVPLLPSHMIAAENAAVEIAKRSKSSSKARSDQRTREEILQGRYIHWLDGPLYISGMMMGWIDHPWHATTALSQLWYIKRHNYTYRTIPRNAAGFDREDTSAPDYGKVYNDERQKYLWRRETDLSPKELRTYERYRSKQMFVHSMHPYESMDPQATTDPPSSDAYLTPFDDPRYGYRLSQANIPFPSMDNLLIHIGDSTHPKFGKQNLGKWLTGIYPLLTQPHTTLLTKRSLERDLAVGRSEVQALLCSTQTVVLGLQPRIFTGIADAAAFRSQAWALAGIDLHKVRAYDRYPPRKITVIGRSSTTRALLHREKIMHILKLTGLPFEYVSDIGLLPWKEQVTLMAHTGILISAHGAALTNIMYLPAHAVVIEAFPYLMNWPLYRRLAEVMNLYYYRLPSSRPYKKPSSSSVSPLSDDNTGFELMDAESFYAHCEDPQRVSSLDANLLTACNGRSKNVKINLNFRLFTETLVTALDDIGCRPRQFLPRQIAVLIAAQKAVERIKNDHLSIPVPSLPIGPELEDRFRSNQPIDPYYPLDPSDDGRYPWDDEGIGADGQLTPRAAVGISLAVRLGVDLRASLDTGNDALSSPSGLRKKSKWKTLGLTTNPSYLAFYQPEDDSAFILNLAGKCIDKNVIFEDRNPWDETNTKAKSNYRQRRLMETDDRVEKSKDTTDQSIVLDPEVSALFHREQEQMMKWLAMKD